MNQHNKHFKCIECKIGVDTWFEMKMHFVEVHKLKKHPSYVSDDKEFVLAYWDYAPLLRKRDDWQRRMNVLE